MINPKEQRHKHLPHCHAVSGDRVARIHLDTFEVLTNKGFSRNDLRRIIDAVKYHRDELVEQWREYHGQE